jgi:adenine-specific DNA methylase
MWSLILLNLPNVLFIIINGIYYFNLLALIFNLATFNDSKSFQHPDRGS